MRVLFVGRFSGRGGAERSFVPLANALVDAGWDVTLLLTRRPLEEHFFEKLRFRVVVAGNYLSLIRIMLKEGGRADIIVSESELTPTYVAWAIARMLDKPMLAEVRTVLSADVRKSRPLLHRVLAPIVYKRVSAIRCVSKGVAEDLVSTLAVMPSRLKTLYNPIDIEGIRNVAKAGTSDASEPDVEEIVIVGRLVPEKRVHLAIDALSILRNRYGHRVKLSVIGDGPERQRLFELVQELNLTEFVHFMGHQPNPFPYVKRARALVLVSEYEGFARVIAEALALGTPVVSVDCPTGPREVLAGGKYGILVANATAQAVADALHRLLCNPEMIHRLQLSGPLRAREFDSSIIAREYVNLLKDTVAKC